MGDKYPVEGESFQSIRESIKHYNPVTPFRVNIILHSAKNRHLALNRESRHSSGWALGHFISASESVQRIDLARILDESIYYEAGLVAA